MKRTDAINKINEMIDSQNGVVEYLKLEAERLLTCGAVDLDDYENDYQLPKIVLTVALKNCADQYKPLFKNKNIEREIKNLENF